MPIIGRSERISIDHHRQGSSGLFPARAPELIAKGGKEERRGFPSDASEGQEDSGQNAAIRSGDDDSGNRLPFAGAEGHGAFSESVWDGAKKFFGAAQGDGNHHQAQSEAAGECGVLLERVNGKAVSKNADDDGGHAVEQVRGITDNKSGGAAAEFGEIDGAKKSDGNPKDRGKQKQLGAAEDGVGHAAAGLADGSGELGEKVPTDGSSAVIDEISKNEEKDGNGDQGTHAGHRQHEAAHKFAPAEMRAHTLPSPLPRWEVATISKRAKPLRMNVGMKSTQPTSRSPCLWRSPVASVNSLAMTAAMEEPGEKREALMTGELA